VFNN
jgi:hypothetical protein